MVERAVSNERIRVLIVDDHLAVAEGLHALLSRQPDFELTDIATNGEVARRIAAEQRPHVVLMDQNLSGDSGVAVAGAILAAGVPTSVVMFSGGMTQDELVEAVEVGVSGYLMKTTPVAQIVDAIRRAASGDMLLPREELNELLRAGRERARKQAQRQRAAPQLTPREREVLALMAQAHDVQRIAERLGISVNTTRGYVQQVLEKLDAHSRLEAVVRANELGLLSA
jgi:DNA-binding NarL/FixJ family response regulator